MLSAEIRSASSGSPLEVSLRIIIIRAPQRVFLEAPPEVSLGTPPEAPVEVCLDVVLKVLPEVPVEVFL